MASSSRSFVRLARSSPLRNAALRPTSFAPRPAFRQTARRTYADSAPKSGGSNVALFSVLGLTLAGVGAYYTFGNPEAGAKATKAIQSSIGKQAGSSTPAFRDYQEVYNEIAHRLAEHDEYEDGSYGPVLLRLGWHASGTYDAKTNTGGSNGATMRFAPESDHGANAGLRTARDFVEPVKQKFPWITYSDLWTLSAVAAIQEMQGPTIPWRPGRADREAAWCSPDGRLPDGAKEHKHLRDIFGRMGFSDQEIVALSGAHALGRCHTDRSGFDGPWTFSPTVLTNDYYKLLVEEKWAWKKWNGPKQYEDVSTKSLMMLPTDMALIKDKSFKPWVDKYAADNDKFFEDFGSVITKLFELGVPFTTSEDSRFRFQRSE